MKWIVQIDFKKSDYPNSVYVKCINHLSDCMQSGRNGCAAVKIYFNTTSRGHRNGLANFNRAVRSPRTLRGRRNHSVRRHIPLKYCNISMHFILLCAYMNGLLGTCCDAHGHGHARIARIGPDATKSMFATYSIPDLNVRECAANDIQMVALRGSLFLWIFHCVKICSNKWIQNDKLR